MTDSTALKVFKCPSCGAPLDPGKGGSSLKCPYCGASVIVPESLRSPDPLAQYTSLSDVTKLAREGRLDDAAKVYSKITGLKHEYALESVKSMAGMHDSSPQQGTAALNTPSARPNYQPPPQPMPVYTPRPTIRIGGGSCLSGAIRLVIFFAILTSAIPAIWTAFKFQLPFEIPFLTGENSIIPEPYAKETLSFRASTLKDPRAIQVDGEDNILVFNYNSSDIQMFDPQGNEIFVMEITESDGDRLNNDIMGVSKEGTIYVPGFRSIMVFNEKGERLREFPNEDNLFIIYSLLIGADDKLYARSSSGIARLDDNGKVDLFISDETLQEITGETPGTGAIGADAQGNIYFSGTFNTDVLKFSPNGEFIGKFGGDFSSVRGIEIDRYGRIYIVDFSEVKVYDANFNYINNIDGGFWGVDFDSQNNMYAITNQGDRVVKFEIRKPDGQ